MTSKECDIGLVGLGVMGGNFALNMADKGFRVGVYNRTEEKTRTFLQGEAEGRPMRPAYSLEELSRVLKKPKAVMVFVPAGDAVDEVIRGLGPNLDSGDLIVDSGNSHFKDTNRRKDSLARRGIHYLGMGVSGGEDGARHGPSMMPGGSEEGYKRIQSILEASAARIDGEPCVAYLGPGSSGHYVKMIHNGIEYGIMQLIAESYDLLKRGLGLEAEQLPAIYEQWNQGKLNSYLMEITARVLARRDEKTGKPLVEMILDRASQKGTGKWTSQDGMDLSTPVPNIDTAVAMRNMSDYRKERLKAAEALKGSTDSFRGDREDFIRQMGESLFAGFILTYAQGMHLLRRASRDYQYKLDMEVVARIWRGGCIIRARLLEDIRKAFLTQSDLENLILSPDLGREVMTRQGDLRKVVCAGINLGLPVPGFMSALSYYDAYRSPQSPANLIMAQRDCFGAHRYERIDSEGTFHTEWES